MGASDTTAMLKDHQAHDHSQGFAGQDVTLDPNYMRSAYQVITDALRSGYDVTQMPNGDVIIRVLKSVDLCYRWNSTKNRMERMIPGVRVKRLRKQRQESAQAAAKAQQEMETDFVSGKDILEEEVFAFEDAS